MRIVVVGGGIAGVSIAAELSTTHDVVLLEMESQLAHHTTGRSAAMYLGSYGNPIVKALTADSLEGFHEMSSAVGFPLLSPRPLVTIFGDDETDQVDDVVSATPTSAHITLDELFDLAPYLDQSAIGAATIDHSGYDIDVAALHQEYVKRMTANGAEIIRGCRADTITFNSTTTVSTQSSTHEADLVVNAAGAWGDDVARRAGCAAAPLIPKRRTIFTSRVSPDLPPGPMILRHPEEFYFRVDNGTLLGSPADETPSEPCDSRPEELDVALAIESVNSVTTLNIRSVDSTWSGLRTFAPDKSPVVGSRDGEPGFFWFCGQGGYGIQMAPKLAKLAAQMVDGELSTHDRGLADSLSPKRFTAN